MNTANQEPKNGDVQVITIPVHQVRTSPFDNDSKPSLLGKFGVVVEPHAQNDSGVIAMTEKQLKELALQLSLDRWQTMARAVNRRDSQLEITYKYCEAGQPREDNPEEVYGANNGGKSWWKRESTVLIPGDMAYDYVDKVTLQADVASEVKAQELHSATAKDLSARRNRLRNSLLQKAAPNPTPNPAPEPEAPEQEELIEEAPKGAKAGAKAAK